MRDASSHIYIDLSDLVVAAIWHPTCGGIPRVQLEVANALVRSNPSALPFSLYNDTWRDLRPLIEEANGDTDKVFSRLSERFAYVRERPPWRKPFRLAKLMLAHLKAFYEKLRSQSPQLKADDTLYVGGAFWMNKTIMDLCRRAAASGANLIVLFHDLIPITNPHFTGHDFSDEYRAILRLPAHFIVTTDFNRTEIETVRQKMGVGDGTFTSTIALADEFPGVPRNAQSLLIPKRLVHLAARPFVLCVGTIEVRKNHMMLLSAWDELAAELGDQLPTLVVAGRRGWKADAALRRLDELRDSDDPIILVEAPLDEELRWLYSACAFTVFPSLFEGWGLPVGESFWFGKACAASDTSSIPAVGRDLCLYFSPHDIADIKAAIRQLLDPDVRRSYEAKIAAASLRSWADVAGDVEQVILQRSPAPLDGPDRAAVPHLDARAC